MTLLIGFDPGGSDKKWGYVCATSDLNSDLFIGWLREPGVGTAFDTNRFPFLTDEQTSSIGRCLASVLRDLLIAAGVNVKREQKPLNTALEAFDGIIVAVDAPSGFAIHGQRIRDTERAALGNFNTPDKGTFLERAEKWILEGNQTPLQQRVWWKLVGFSIYAYFLECDCADDIAHASTSGLLPSLEFAISGDLTNRVQVIESFPTQTYEATSTEAFSVISSIARRRLRQLPSSPLPHITFNRFQRLLGRLARGDMKSWNRVRTRVGDALDAFASMALGQWSRTIGLRAIGNDLNRLRLEGAIMVPALPLAGEEYFVRTVQPEP